MKLIVWMTVSPEFVPPESARVLVMSAVTVPENVRSEPVICISPVGGTDSGGEP